MPYYAQINAERIVLCVTQTAEAVTNPQMVAIDSYDASLLGKRHNLGSGLFEEVAPEPTGEDERLWWLDVGPFKDRLGMDAPAIYASNHAACRGVVGMLEGRKYIHLKDPRIAAMMGVLIASGQPAAGPVWPGSGPMTAAKRDTILNTPTTEAERHIKGLEG